MTELTRAEVTIGGNDTPLLNTLSRSARSLEQAGQRMARIGRTMTARITAPLVAAGGAALKFSSDFEQSMMQLQTLVGLSGDRVDELRERILDLAPAVGKTPQELSEAMFAITSGGLRGAEAMETLEQAAKASAIGLGNVTEIGRTATAALQAFGDSGLTAEKAIDTLVATVRTGNLRADELAGSLGRVIGIADAAGVSFEELNGFIATFTRLGAPAEVAATALRATLSAVIKPTNQTREAFQSLGTSVAEFRQEIRDRGLAVALTDLIAGAEGNIEVIAQLIPNVRALAGVLGTAGSQSEEFIEIQQQIQDSLGSTNQGFEEIQGTTAQTFAELKSQAATLAITFGDELAPTFDKILTKIADLFKSFTELSEGTKETILIVGGLAAAMGPVIFLAGQLTLAVTGVTKAFVALRGVQIGSAVAGWASAFASLAVQVRSVQGAMALLAMSIGGLATAGLGIIVGLGIKRGFERWADAGSEAREELDNLRGSLEKLNESATEMTRAQLAQTIASLEGRAESIRREIEANQRQLDRMEDLPVGGGRLGVGVDPGKLNELRRSQDALEEQSNEVRSTIEDLTGQLQSMGRESEEAARSTRETGEAAEDAIPPLFSFQQVMESGAAMANVFGGAGIGVSAMLAEVAQRSREASGGMEELDRHIERVRERNERIRERAGQRVEGLVSDVRLAKIQEQMRLLNDAADRMARGFVSAFEAIGEGSKSVVDAITDMVTNIIAEMARLQAQKMFAQFFSGLLGGGIPDAPGPITGVEAPSVPGFDLKAPGMQHGGQFTVGGSGGADSQLVQFAATPGEVVTVQPKGKPSGGGGMGGPVNVNINVKTFDSKDFSRGMLETGLLQQSVKEAVRQSVDAPTKSDAVRRQMVSGRG